MVGAWWLAGGPVLSLKWRADAAVLRHRGAVLQAEVLEQCAAELEACERERGLEQLTLEQAAAESGYSYSQLQKLVGSGALTNVGDKHRPRVRRGELPRKAGRVQPEGEPDLAALVQGRRGAR